MQSLSAILQSPTQHRDLSTAAAPSVAWQQQRCSQQPHSQALHQTLLPVSALGLARQMCSSTGVDKLLPGHGTSTGANSEKDSGSSSSGGSGDSKPDLQPAELLQVSIKCQLKVAPASKLMT